MHKNIEKMRTSKKITKDFLNNILNENINTEINTEYENILEDNILDLLKKWFSDNLVETISDDKIKFNDLWERYNKDISYKRYNVKKTKLKEYIVEIYEDQSSKNGDIQGVSWR